MGGAPPSVHVPLVVSTSCCPRRGPCARHVWRAGVDRNRPGPPVPPVPATGGRRDRDVVEHIAGLAEEIVDLAAQEAEREHGRQRDECDDQGVFNEALTALVPCRDDPRAIESFRISIFLVPPPTPRSLPSRGRASEFPKVADWRGALVFILCPIPSSIRFRGPRARTTARWRCRPSHWRDSRRRRSSRHWGSA